ncbi:MAG: NADH-quinone oxidoreductase subunit A [Candidatus Omnitrophota bacterium]
MDKLLLSPPVAFIIVLAVCFLLARLFSKLSFRPKSHTGGEGESYACGEKTYDNTAQPDYNTFFAFAFFFTIAHVATLIMATVHAQNMQAFVLAFLYIIGTVTGLYILLRK